jgi:outer membrane protein
MRNIIRGSLAALLLWSGALRAETLADALVAGYESSGLIEQNRAVLRAADEDVAQAVGALRPVVEWIASVSGSLRYGEAPTLFGSAGNELQENLSANLGLRATLTLYDGGGRRLAIEAQKEIVLATRQALINVEQQVLGRIVQAYLEVLRAGSFVQLRENNVRLITQELRAAEDRFDVGEITRTDVALAEARLAAARSLLAAEQGGLARAQEEFRAAVGEAPRALSPVAPARIPQSIDEARSIALRSHPALLQARHDVAAAEIAIARSEALLRPRVNLEAQLGIDQEFEESASVTLGASAPIYQGGQLASQIRQFQARRDAARGQLLETSRQIEQTVGNAYSFLEVARASRQAFEQQVSASQVAFEGVREEAQLGARTTLDVLDAEQELLDARTSLVDAEVNETVASYSVLQSMGMLTARNLGLNVQNYDPTAYYNLVDDAPTRRSEQGEALDRVLESIGQE